MTQTLCVSDKAMFCMSHTVILSLTAMNVVVQPVTKYRRRDRIVKWHKIFIHSVKIQSNTALRSFFSVFNVVLKIFLKLKTSSLLQGQHVINTIKNQLILSIGSTCNSTCIRIQDPWPELCHSTKNSKQNIYVSCIVNCYTLTLT